MRLYWVGPLKSWSKRYTRCSPPQDNGYVVHRAKRCGRISKRGSGTLFTEIRVEVHDPSKKGNLDPLSSTKVADEFGHK